MNDGAKNHYETLGIPKTAAAHEVKRAYFTLVKRYSPERFPEEFKAIREAYDILGNEQKRAEYDKPDNLSPEVRAVLETAGGYVRMNSLERAAGFLKTEVPKYPDVPEIKARLAEVFERQGKKGLAAKLWEEIWEGLPAAHTEKAFYAKRLAIACSGRGWNKKALDMYEKALELDPSDAETWESYVDMRYDSDEWDKTGELCKRALTALNSAGKDSAKIRAGCVFFLAKGPEDADFIKEHLTAMKTILQSLPIGGWGLGVVDTAFEGVMQSENAVLLPMIRELYDLSPRKAPNLDKKLEKAQFYYELDKLDKNGFSDIVYDICLTMLQDPPGDERDLEMAAMEYHILDKLEDHRRELSRLKKEFPKLYGLHGNFFDEAQRTRDTAGLINKRVKKLGKYYKAKQENQDGREESSAPLQTVRRESPKVGRNDPCPCGSGKKYKRCCGAGA